MKVWELMAKLAKCRADATVWIGAANYEAVEAESFDYTDEDDAPIVNITSQVIAEPLE